MAALFPTTKWDNIENKPSTFEPTVGDVSGTAYDGAKGKNVKEILDKIVKGTTIVPKAKYADSLSGYTAVYRVGVFNPAGINHVIIPCEGKDVHFAYAINGNWAAAPIGIVCVVRYGENL